MVALSTIALVGASVVGAGAAIAGVSQQKKAAAQQTARINKQEADAKAAAREQAGLDTTRDTAGADIKLGQDGAKAKADTAAGAGTGGATDRTGSVASRVGGIKELKPKASRSIGL